MNALVASKVDAFDRYADTRQKRLDEVGPVADEREDRTIVVGIDVRVEEPRRPRAATPQLSATVAASRAAEKFGTDSSGSATEG